MREQTKKIEVEKVVEFLKANGGGTHIKRSKTAKVTCDLVLPGTIRNDDSLERGPDERILFGSRGEVAYPIESLARYMVRRGFVIVTNAGFGGMIRRPGKDTT